MKRTLPFFFLLLLCFCISANAQTTITGVVTDASTQLPLSGVSVNLKSGSGGTSTNENGAYSLKAGSNDVLIFSYTGFTTLTISAQGRAKIDISMSSNVAQLNEVVLIGTRSAGRVKLETAVPVDVVNIGKASANTGRVDITDILNYAATTLNYNKQTMLS
jgi:iron complex outermembrane receptor protein